MTSQKIPGAIPAKIKSRRIDTIIAVTLFIASFLVFWASPIHPVTDSGYSMLVSEALIRHGTFSLDPYSIPRNERYFHDNTFKNGHIYQIEYVGDRLFYYFPPGSSILSAPFVAVMNWFGMSASNPDGTYSFEGESKIETVLAALLMALLAVCFYFTARLLLPSGWSLLVVLFGAFSTPIWSTASRVVWGDTWAALLTGIALLMLLADRSGKQSLKPILLGTLLAWCFFVRPTTAVSILAFTAYLFLFRPGIIPKYLLTGAAWLTGFVIYSLWNFNERLPKYYQPGRLGYSQFWEALPGNLISPSRGLIVFVPVLLFVGYLLIRYWRFARFKPVVWLGVIVLVAHTIVVSGFSPWNGGACYGPRYMTSVVPWMVVLGVIAIEAFLVRRKEPGWQGSALTKSELSAGAILLILSLGLNARGAISIDTWVWNSESKTEEEHDRRVWDWRYPQFLAGIIAPPLKQVFPLVDSTIDLTTAEADKYIRYGWSGSEKDFRWTEKKEAAMAFRLLRTDYSVMRFTMRPFLTDGKVAAQRCEVLLNGRQLTTLVLSAGNLQDYTVALPTGILERDIQLVLKLPDAAAPKQFGISNDSRELGLAVTTIQFE